MDSNPGSLDCESGILPLSYRAPRRPTYGSPGGSRTHVTGRACIFRRADGRDLHMELTARLANVSAVPAARTELDDEIHIEEARMA